MQSSLTEHDKNRNRRERDRRKKRRKKKQTSRKTEPVVRTVITLRGLVIVLALLPPHSLVRYDMRFPATAVRMRYKEKSDLKSHLRMITWGLRFHFEQETLRGLRKTAQNGQRCWSGQISIILGGHSEIENRSKLDHGQTKANTNIGGLEQVWFLASSETIAIRLQFYSFISFVDFK